MTPCRWWRRTWPQTSRPSPPPGPISSWPSNYGEDGDYQRLGQVAPTVAVASDFDPPRRAGIAWVRDTMRTVAVALGRSAEAKAPIEGL